MLLLIPTERKDIYCDSAVVDLLHRVFVRGSWRRCPEKQGPSGNTTLRGTISSKLSESNDCWSYCTQQRPSPETTRNEDFVQEVGVELELFLAANIMRISENFHTTLRYNVKDFNISKSSTKFYNIDINYNLRVFKDFIK